MRDYEAYYAMIEDAWYAKPITGSISIPVEEIARLRLAAETLGVSTEQFVDIAVLERLEQLMGIWPYSILSHEGLQPCFFCDELTPFVDLAFEAPFCNSGICNWGVNEDLRMLAEYV